LLTHPSATADGTDLLQVRLTFLQRQWHYLSLYLDEVRTTRGSGWVRS